MRPTGPADQASVPARQAGMEIRAVDGPRTGARHRIEVTGALRLSTGYGADIVLRDRAHPFSARLDPAPGAALRLTVEHGEAAMLGMPVAVGASCLWPPFTPLAIGPHVLAHGEAESPRWDELRAIVSGLLERPADVPEEMHNEGRLTGIMSRLPQRYRRPLCGGVAAAALVAAFLATPVPELPRVPVNAAAVSRILADEGLGEFEVRRAAGGVVLISGAPASAEALGRAQDRLRRAGVPHRIDLMTESEILSAAEDVARLHGVAAKARFAGADAVVLETGPLDPDSRARLAAVIRADVPAIRELSVQDGLAVSDPAAPRSVSEAAKRVATVVKGDPSYVLTADGARYFPGALLPSGHILDAIEDNAILITRNGATTRVRF